MALVDFADEEGARFGRSLFGSSAVAGTLDPAALEDLSDAEGRGMREVLAEHDVDIDEAPQRGERMREGLRGLPRAAHRAGPGARARGDRRGRGDRHRRRGAAPARFEGQAAHAGTTPMDMRRDAGLAAAATALAVEDVARRHGGVGTCGALQPRARRDHRRARGRPSCGIDLRHTQAEALAAMLEIMRAAARRGRGQPPAARRARSRSGASSRSRSTSGWWPPRRRRPARTGRSPAAPCTTRRRWPATCRSAMVFAPSSGGLSHAKEEDTPEADLEKAIDAYGRLALRVIGGEVV